MSIVSRRNLRAANATTNFAFTPAIAQSYIGNSGRGQYLWYEAETIQIQYQPALEAL